jgi:23S rRNA pseudouridine955/2504/2580 synthase
MAETMIEKKITTQEQGARLDRCLRLWIPHLQQAIIERAARKGLLKIDGKKAKPSHRVLEGQILSYPKGFMGLEIDVPPQEELHLTNAERKWIKSLIIHEDEDLVVLNKPAGIPVQKGTKQHKALDSLIDAYYEGSKTRLVHRLDKDTSGIFVLARTLPMARWLTQAFKERTVHKTYWALVCGIPQKKEGLISLPLTKKADSEYEKIHVDHVEGLHATTYFRIIESLDDKFAWLELSPKTGRTHQLRVHCAEGLQTPILGDGKYGGKDAFPMGRTGLHLHAHSLTIPLPKGHPVTFEAPLPDEQKETYIKLGFDLV